MSRGCPSDGSEASNSSSSASAINDHGDHPPSSHHHLQHSGGSSNNSSREHHSKQCEQQLKRHHRSSTEAVLRQRAANRQDLAHQRLLDHEDIQRLDEWTSHHPAANQRQSSLAETDCDVSKSGQKRWPSSSSSSHAILDVSRICPTHSPMTDESSVHQETEETDVVLDMPPSTPSAVS